MGFAEVSPVYGIFIIHLVGLGVLQTGFFVGLQTGFFVGLQTGSFVGQTGFSVGQIGFSVGHKVGEGVGSYVGS